MNRLEKIYAKIIFYIFSNAIKRFYGSDSKVGEKTEVTYQRMLRMKQRVYSLFDFLTRTLKENKGTYLLETRFDGIRFFIRPLILSDIIMVSGAWEPYVKKIFVAKNNDVVIDVGAHIGTYTIPLAFAVGNSGKVIALEPNQNNAVILEKNIEINKLSNVVLIKKAAGRQVGILDLKLTSDPMLSMIDSKSDSEHISVETTDLDSLIDNLSIDRVNWLKIDAEGFELEVLEGGKQILEQFSPKIIIEARKENQENMKKILLRYGYNIRYLTGEYFVAEK